MKKIFILVVAFVFSINMASAAQGGMIKNYHAYTVKGHNIRETAPIILDIAKKYPEIHIISGCDNTYYFLDSKTNEANYLRLYPNGDNTDFYIVANATYNKENNELTKLFDNLDWKYEKLKNKSALKEYQFDFFDLARKDKLDGFFIAPDCVKPLKIGMKKLNDKMAKNNEKTSAIPYSVDNEPIDLECVDTECYKDTASQTSITRKEYRLKQKENKYVHAFEYTLKNDANSKVLVKNVTSERLAGIKDVTTEAFVDLDRLDLVDTVGSFPPVVICTAGLSLLCSVPNWVRLGMITKESVRYTHALPDNYTLDANKSMRILVLKYKNNKKPLNFTLIRNDNTYQYSF